MVESSFTILGSSSGLPQPDRACSGYLLKTEESLSLFDCGSGVVSSFLREGFDPLKLDRIFITHTNTDHVGDLALFVQMLHVMKANRPLAVYLPEEFVQPFHNLLNAVYMFPEHIHLKLTILSYETGPVYDDLFALTAIANTHLAKAAPVITKLQLPNKMQSYSFKIQINTRSLLYSGDIGSFDDLEEHLNDVDLAIVESTHSDPDRVLAFAREHPSTDFVLTHLGGADEVADLARRIAEAKLDHVRLAQDSLRFSLSH